MKKLIQRIKNANIGDTINFCCFLASIIMGVISFFYPPKGQIDNSVLMFIAEVGIFSTISQVPNFIRAVSQNHTPLEIKKGETTIKIGDEDNK